MTSTSKMKSLHLSDDEKTLLAMHREVVIEREDCPVLLQGDLVHVDQTLTAKVRLSAYRSGMVTVVLDLLE